MIGLEHLTFRRSCSYDSLSTPGLRKMSLEFQDRFLTSRDSRFQGVGHDDNKVLVLAATNTPYSLDQVSTLYVKQKGICV